MTNIVFVTGAFDILHAGHIDLLNYAKSLGDYLLVAIDSDDRIKNTKGNDRPVNTYNVRGKILLNIKAVDDVIVFRSDEELINICKTYNPDIRVIGSDWKHKSIVGEKYCKEIKFFDRENDESTTKTLKDYVARRKLQ